MIKKITMSLIAVAAIGTMAFVSPTIHQDNYLIDTKLSTSTWLSKKVTGQHEGGISISSGNVIIDHGTIVGGNFEFDMNSITCTDIKDAKSNADLIGHLKSDDFFSTEKNKTAKFVLTKAVFKEGNNFEITGKLTIKGITNDITFPALIKMDGKKMVTVAKIMVNRTKYDIKYGSKSFFESIGDKAIDDEFELNINVVAIVK